MATFFSEGVYRAGGGVSVPRWLSLRKPDYTTEARAARIEGGVDLLISIRQTKHIFSCARAFDGVVVWTTKNNDPGGGEAVKKPTVWQSNVKRAV